MLKSQTNWPIVLGHAPIVRGPIVVKSQTSRPIVLGSFVVISETNRPIVLGSIVVISHYYNYSGTSLNNFAFGGARAVYKLLSNSSNTAARNWLLISVSGVRPSFEACQTTPQSLTASVPTEITSFKEKIDNINCFNINTGVFRCAASGLYLINSTVVFERAAADYYGNVWVYKNRSQYRQISGGGGTGASYANVSGSLLMRLNVGDSVQLYGISSISTNMRCLTFSASQL